MRVRTAKQRAQRIDLDYFKQARGLTRWRMLLSLALPVAALAWVGAVAASGNRASFSPGPVSTAHAFAERRCEVCHTGGLDPRVLREGRPFRAHTSDAACLTCHDAPAHAINQTPPPACATCHRDHRGRVQLAAMDDGFCVECHGELKTTQGPPKAAIAVHAFPANHPEFAAVNGGAQDPARLRFNHAVHLKGSLRGPTGPETLECAACHTPEAGRAGVAARGPAATGVMAPVTYERNCARCHPLFFDERIAYPAPHLAAIKVRAFVRQELAVYIREHPEDISKPDSAFRRVPLNFPRPPDPPARNAAEWLERRAAADERLLWSRTCSECHLLFSQFPTSAGLPAYAPTNVTRRWMPRAGFDHTPHRMVTCASCHAAGASTETSDVLLPGKAICATCHAPAKGAAGRCVECHRYHDWQKSHPVNPAYSPSDFK